MKMIEFFFLEMQNDGTEDCIDVLVPLDWPEEYPFRTAQFWNRYARKRAAKYRKEGRQVRAIRLDSGEDEKPTLH